MSIRTLVIAAATAAIFCGTAAQAAVVGPHSTVPSAAKSLNSIEQVRRICRTRLVCTKFPCRFVQQCYVTSDYPPEHGQR